MISSEPAPMLEDKEKWFGFKFIIFTYSVTVIVSANLQSIRRKNTSYS